VAGIRTTLHSADDVIAAIKGSAGIKTTIAKRLNVTRLTIDNYLERWVTVREAYQTEKAGIDDAAQSVVINDILQNRSVETAKWWLRVKMPAEFNPPTITEVSGPKGGPIEHKDVGFSDDERRIRVAKLLNTAGARRARQTPDDGESV
jgi:hypothetical protein